MVNIKGVGSKSNVVGAKHIQNLDPKKWKTIFANLQSFSPWDPPIPGNYAKISSYYK